MNKLRHRMPRLLLGAAALLVVGRPAYAWDPPDGVVLSNGSTASDQAVPPATPTTLLPKAHGYITQNGISILYNDGYWFAAQTLRQWQQELLNGVRYADVYQGTQQVDLELCELFGVNCNNIDSGIGGASWPYAADNHYFNPDTGKGLQAGFLQTASYWVPYLSPAIQFSLTGGLVFLDVDVQPSLASQYPSALAWIGTEFANAQSAYQGGAPASINGRTGTQLAMFYLGWASHFMQDQSVVHHTFDQPRMHHAEYESWADADTSQNPPIWNRAFSAPPSVANIKGIYSPPASPFCSPGTAACFGAYANSQVHNSGVLSAIDNASGKDTSSVQSAIPLIEGLQAGLYRFFFTSVGHPPVHMSAVMPSIYNF